MSVFVEHLSREGDRWDLLAWTYYGDAHAYQGIVEANPEIGPVPRLPAGIKVRIPVVAQPLDRDGLPPWKRSVAS